MSFLFACFWFFAGSWYAQTAMHQDTALHHLPSRRSLRQLYGREGDDSRMKPLTVGDHVRVKATGEIMVVDLRTDISTGLLTLSRWGQMSGGLVVLPDRLEVRREDVVKIVQTTEWVDDED